MALREMITRGERIAGAGRGTRRMAIVEAVTCKAVAMDGECYEDGTRADLRPGIGRGIVSSRSRERINHQRGFA